MSLLVELVGEIDVSPAIQQIAQIEPGPLQMDRIDLEIAPVQSAIGVVVIDLALALRIFSALNGQGDAAIRTELPAGVLLPCGEAVAVLVPARFHSVFRG